MVTYFLIFLALLAVERFVELLISRRNAAWALSRGGVESGQRHFGVMKLLHTGFFFACAAEVVLLDRPFIPELAAGALAIALAAQGLRYWAISALGRQWNVRVIVIPGEAAVTSGPYRFLRHPNYLAVVLEGLAVPLIHGGWLTAITFTLLNALLLIVRIRCEEEALMTHTDYDARLGDRHRFLPALGRGGEP